MHPLWQLSHSSYRFGLWRFPTSGFFTNPLPYFNPPVSINPSALVSTRLHKVLANHLPPTLSTNRQYHPKMDDLQPSADKAFDKDKDGRDNIKRMQAFVNSPPKVLCAGNQASGFLTDMGPNVSQVVHLHTGSDMSKMTELKVEESVDDKPKQPPTETCSLEMMAERFHQLRSWKQVAQMHPSEIQQEFTLLSYNVLAQNLLEDNQYLYCHCDPEILSWPYRRDRLFKELIGSGADIFCLQEVQHDHYSDDFQPYFEKQGYNSIYKKRTGGKVDGCAIFYKTSEFELDKWIAVEYNKPGVYVLDRDNIGIVALLRPTKDPNTLTRVCVATTHLLFNPRRGDVKLAQLQVLLAEIDNFAFKRFGASGTQRYHPIILCGDMNSEPHCQIYNFVSTGMLNYIGLPVATMSGQSEDGWYRNQRQLTAELLPPSLGITDQCQYIRKLSERYQNQWACVSGSNDVQNSENETNVASTDRECESNASSSVEPSNVLRYAYYPVELTRMFSSGMMLHHLNLMSVYKHELERCSGVKEVTTQHSRASCTVDYIFFSVKRKNSYVERGESKAIHKRVKENKLKLLAYCELLSGREVRYFGGLPNALCPSDHLPLIAKFALKL